MRNRLLFQRSILLMASLMGFLASTGCSAPIVEKVTAMPISTLPEPAATQPDRLVVAPTLQPVTTETNTPESYPTITAAPQVKVIRFGTGQIGTDIYPYHQIIHEYERVNPDVLIQVEPMPDSDYYARLEKLLQVGEAPDMVYLADDYLPYLVRKGILKPLEFSSSASFEPAQYFPGLLEPGQIDGKQYLLPGDFSTLVLYYNKFLFSKAGVPFPEDNWTWDDLLAAARMLTKDTNRDGKPEQWGIQMNANWDTGFEYWVAAAGGSLISPDGRQVVGYMDSDETIRAAQFYANIYNTQKVAPPPADLLAWAGGNTEFAEGKAAMVIFGRWVEPEYLANPKIDLGVSPPPRDKVRANILFWSGSGITANSPYSAEATRFLTYAYGEDSAIIWKEWTLPVLSSHVNKDDIALDPFWRIWYQELNFVKPRGYSRTPFWEEAIRPHIQNALDTLVMDPQADPTVVMKEAAAQAQADLEGMLAR